MVIVHYKENLSLHVGIVTPYPHITCTRHASKLFLKKYDCAPIQHKQQKYGDDYYQFHRLVTYTVFYLPNKQN